MKHRYFLICASLFSVHGTFAQAPNIQWQHPLGGFLDERAYAVQPTTDGGSIAAGYTTSTDGDVTTNQGNGDMWLAKLDATGALEWQRTLGGSMDEIAYAVQQTSDGGYVMAGYTASNDGDVSGNQGVQDIWVVKLDGSGIIEWQKTLGGTYYDRAYGVQQAADGGFLIAGTTSSVDGDVTGAHQLGTYDAWVVKLDALGTMVWQRALGGTLTDQANAIVNTADGGSLVAGFATSNDGDVSGMHGTTDMWVVKLDASGYIQWQQALGGNSGEEATGITTTDDGGSIVVGHAISNNGQVSGNHGAIDAWVVKLDSQGAFQWQHALGGLDADRANGVIATAGGGCIISGYTHSFDGDIIGEHGGGDAWVVELDAAGVLLWQKPVGGSLTDEAFGLAPAVGGGTLLAGYTLSNDMDVSGSHGNEEFWVVKLDEGSVGVAELAPPALTVSPNPAHDQLRISFPEPLLDARLTLTDVLGRTVVQQRISGGSYTLELGAQPRGVYLLTVRSATLINIQRLVLE